MSFDEMVAAYADVIVSQWPARPYFVAGYSFGGAVIFEIGKRLEVQGRAVAWVGAIAPSSVQTPRLLNNCSPPRPTRALVRIQ